MPPVQVQPLPGTEPNYSSKRWHKMARFVQILLTVALVVGALQIFAVKPTVRFGEKVIRVDVARTTEELATGLSGRKELAANKGLLFIFGKDDAWSIWMKDMNFPIDIIWLDAQKQVVTIEENVSPETYPEGFVPTSPARYVLEVPAGTVDALDIQIGQTATLDL